MDKVFRDELCTIYALEDKERIKQNVIVALAHSVELERAGYPGAAIQAVPQVKEEEDIWRFGRILAKFQGLSDLHLYKIRCGDTAAWVGLLTQ